jgi:hypothetical protein
LTVNYFKQSQPNTKDKIMKLADVAEPRSAVEFLIKFHAVCKRRRLRVERAGRTSRYAIPKTVINPSRTKTLLVLAGVHGDSPAGPTAVLEWLEKGDFPFGLRIVLLPLLNPDAYARRTKGRTDLELVRECLRDVRPGLVLVLREGAAETPRMTYSDGLEKAAKEMLGVVHARLSVSQEWDKVPQAASTSLEATLTVPHVSIEVANSGPMAERTLALTTALSHVAHNSAAFMA